MNADPLIVEAAERLFADAADLPFDAALWQRFNESGLAAVMVDASLADAVAVCRVAGRCAAALPVAEAIVAQAVAARCGIALPAQPVALAPLTHRADIGIRDGQLSGHVHGVPFGRHGAAVLVGVWNDTEQLRQLAWAEVDDAHWEPADGLAGEPSDTLRLAARPARVLAGEPADDALELAALLRAAQMSGAMERALELALEHAKTRVQFGKPIAQFQAVQQMLARLGAECAAAAAAVDMAVQRSGSAEDANGRAWCDPFGAAVAKARCSEAAGVVAELAHQVIAAMGFTREFPLHRCTRRLWAWREDFGNEAFWQRRLGRMAASAPSAWHLIAG